MKIVIIVAATRDLAIGSNGDLLYHISADLKRFKALTMGYPIIMGRKTFLSFPNGALPGRRNVVITRDTGFSAPGVEVAHSVGEALSICVGAEKAYVIGGGEVYRQFLPLADEIELTLIDDVAPQAEVRFPEIALPEAEFTETDPKTGVRYCFLSLIPK